MYVCGEREREREREVQMTALLDIVKLYVYVCMCVCIYIHIYIYIYRFKLYACMNLFIYNTCVGGWVWVCIGSDDRVAGLRQMWPPAPP